MTNDSGPGGVRPHIGAICPRAGPVGLALKWVLKVDSSRGARGGIQESKGQKQILLHSTSDNES